MMVVYKFEIVVRGNWPPGKHTVMVPEDFQPLTVQFQRGSICMWGQTSGESERHTSFTALVVATGQKFEAGGELRYLGTVQDGASLVWHVYQVLQ